MTWVKLDDGFAEHEKVAGLSDAAFRVHVSALCWCARRETDGQIPKGAQRILGASTKLAAELVAAGLWDVTDAGHVIHDYLAFNPSRAQLEEQREVAARRSVLRSDPEVMRILKARDQNRCRYCAVVVDWANRRGRTGGTYDHVTPISKGGSDSIDNIVVCCRLCNSRKGCRTPAESGLVLLQVPTGSPLVVTRSPVPGPDPVTRSNKPAAADPRPVSLPRATAPSAAAAAVIGQPSKNSGELPSKPPAAVIGAGDPAERPREVTQVRERLPGNLEEALRVPVCARSELVTSGRTAAQWVQPERWPEVVEVAAALAEGEGRQPLPLGRYDHDAGVRAVVELYAAGFLPGDVKRVARKVPTQAWWTAGDRKRGLANLSPEVMRRGLDDTPNDGGLLAAADRAREARLRRSEPESGPMPVAELVASFARGAS